MKNTHFYFCLLRTSFVVPIVTNYHQTCVKMNLRYIHTASQNGRCRSKLISKKKFKKNSKGDLIHALPLPPYSVTPGVHSFLMFRLSIRGDSISYAFSYLEMNSTSFEQSDHNTIICGLIPAKNISLNSVDC